MDTEEINLLLRVLRLVADTIKADDLLNEFLERMALFVSYVLRENVSVEDLERLTYYGELPDKTKSKSSIMMPSE